MTRKVLSLLLLALSLLALYNVYSDNTSVVKRAESLACGSKPCVRLLRAERTPLSQSFTFQTSINPVASRDVHCEQPFVLFGGFECSATSAR
jgi:hypothetical protein